MKINTVLTYRFAKESGVEAARKRAECGAPESLQATLTVKEELELSLDTLEAAEKSGLLNSNYKELSYIPHTVELPAEVYTLEPDQRVQRWIAAATELKHQLTEKAIADVLARPVSDWIRGQSISRPYVGGSLERAVFSDPRVQAIAAEAEAIADRLREEERARQLELYAELNPKQAYQRFVRYGNAVPGEFSSTFSLLTKEELRARFQEFDEAGDALRKAAKEAEEEAEAQFKEHAQCIGGDAATAAARGYSVKEAVLCDIARQIADAVEQEPIAVLHEGTERYDDASWTRRDSPREAQLQLEATLEEIAESVASPACVEVDVSSVCRIELPVEDEYGDAETRKLTGVVVTLSSPITKDRSLVFSAE